LQPEELLFFDLETTGLARAAGTLPFIIGLGFWGKDHALQIHQLFIRDPGEEAHALSLLKEYLLRARVLVSFNGRSFDLPLLRNRLLLNRCPLPLEEKYHIDLLLLCRRLFRGRLVNCRLGTIERELLGFEREGDVDGSEAPSIYLEYLNTGRLDRIELLLQHNKLDVALMAPLLALLGRHLAEPLHWAEDGEELLAAATLHLKANHLELGQQCLERTLEMARRASTRQRAMISLAQLLRRNEPPERTRLLWEQYCHEFPDEERGWIELAKYHEHVSRDFATALRLLESCPGGLRPKHQKRHARLRRYLDRCTV
jgi:hypothetical protein